MRRLRPLSAEAELFLATSLGLAVIGAGAGLSPATGDDGTAYHLPLAARVLSSGSLDPFESIRFWWFPQLNEVLFALALSAGSARTAQLLGIALFALSGLGAFAMARRASGLGAGLLAAAAWLATPLAAENACGASVDTGPALFAVAGALALALAGFAGGIATWPVLRYALPSVALVCVAGSVGLTNALRLTLGRGAASRVAALLSGAILLLPPGTFAWAA